MPPAPVPGAPMSKSSIGVVPVSAPLTSPAAGERETGQAGRARAEEEHPGDGVGVVRVVWPTF